MMYNFSTLRLVRVNFENETMKFSAAIYMRGDVCSEAENITFEKYTYLELYRDPDLQHKCKTIFRAVTLCVYKNVKENK